MTRANGVVAPAASERGAAWTGAVGCLLVRLAAPGLLFLLLGCACSIEFQSHPPEEPVRPATCAPGVLLGCHCSNETVGFDLCSDACDFGQCINCKDAGELTACRPGITPTCLCATGELGSCPTEQHRAAHCPCRTESGELTARPGDPVGYCVACACPGDVQGVQVLGADRVFGPCDCTSDVCPPGTIGYCLCDTGVPTLGSGPGKGECLADGGVGPCTCDYDYHVPDGGAGSSAGGAGGDAGAGGSGGPAGSGDGG